MRGGDPSSHRAALGQSPSLRLLSSRHRPVDKRVVFCYNLFHCPIKQKQLKRTEKDNKKDGTTIFWS
jgi:hypothetical protein